MLPAGVGYQDMGEKRNILGGNAIKVFNLKLPAKKLARVA